jgi:hypothetical protein
MVPTSPYPNIAASYDLKIVGFRNPMSHFAPPVARYMSRLAHNSDYSFRDRRILFGNRKMTDSGRSGIATIEEHRPKNGLVESLITTRAVTAFISRWGDSLIARPSKESASQYTESARAVQGSVE